MKFNSFLVGQPTNKKNIQLDLEPLIIDLIRQITFIQKEQRCQRGDLKELSQKIDRLLVDKHLQMQVDEYFEDRPDNEDQEPD